MLDLNAVFGCLAIGAQTSGAAIPPLEPKPRKIDVLAGEYRPKPDLTIKAAGTDIPAAGRSERGVVRGLPFRT